MKFRVLNFFLIALIFSINSMAGSPPEPSPFVVDAPKDYYRKAYGYNTQTPCTGEMCLAAGSEVTCNYGYEKGGGESRVQVCNMQTIKNKDGAATDVSKKKFMMVTGIIDSKNEFSNQLPANEVLLATTGMFGKIKKFVPGTPVVKPMTMDELTATFTTVCPPGLECPNPAPCETAGSVNSIACFQEEAATFEDTLAPALVTDFDTKAIGDAYKKMGFASLCSGFINYDGSLGEWGKLVVKSFKEVCNECFFGENNVDVKALCPNFKKFSQAKKEYFWAWTIGSMAHLESSCKTRARVRGAKIRGHQEYAVGIIQLEESYHRRKNRGPECATRPGQSLYDLSFQFACGASIIRDTRWDEGKPLWGNVRRHDQYWQKLKSLVGKSGKMSQNISHFPGCK